MVVGYPILISIGSTILFLHFPLSFSFNWEDISNIQDCVELQLQIPWSLSNITPISVIFCSYLFGVWKCGQTHSCLINNLSKKDQQTKTLWKNLLFPFKPSLIIFVKVWLLQVSNMLPAAARRALWTKWRAHDIKFQELTNKCQLVLKSLNFKKTSSVEHLKSHITIHSNT